MDKSQEYINMCQKAVELQHEHIIRDGDCIIFTKDMDYNIAKGDMIFVGNRIVYDFNSKSYSLFDRHDNAQTFWKYDFIWLPTQDQLQHIYTISFLPDKISSMIRDFKSFVWRFHVYIADAIDGYPLNTCNTMEQLWLCFIMYVSHDKIWDGTDWIAKGDSQWGRE